MLLKKVISIGVFLLCICSLSNAQQPFPSPSDTARTVYADTADTFMDEFSPESRVILGGSMTANTYGMQFSFPTLWIEERVKMELSLGFFWNNFAAEGFDLNPALGGRALYYFKRQSFYGDPINSPYAGIGGMSTELMYFGRDFTDQSKTDIILGYSFSLNPAVQISPELSVGITGHSTYRPELGIHMAVRF